MPDVEGLDADDREEMVTHLLVAADRYGMGRLKQICQSILCNCKSLDVENVATLLALADQHHCSKLRNACVNFIASVTSLNLD
jgi:speckle-type POZ protein